MQWVYYMIIRFSYMDHNSIRFYDMLFKDNIGLIRWCSDSITEIFCRLDASIIGLCLQTESLRYLVSL